MENQKERDIVKRMRARTYPKNWRSVGLTIDISKRIREVLRRRGETVSDLAARMNMQEEAVWKMIDGLYPLSIVEIINFEVALDTKLLQVTTDSAPIV